MGRLWVVLFCLFVFVLSFWLLEESQRKRLRSVCWFTPKLLQLLNPEAENAICVFHTGTGAPEPSIRWFMWLCDYTGGNKAAFFFLFLCPETFPDFMLFFFLFEQVRNINLMSFLKNLQPTQRNHIYLFRSLRLLLIRFCLLGREKERDENSCVLGNALESPNIRDWARQKEKRILPCGDRRP